MQIRKERFVVVVKFHNVLLFRNIYYRGFAEQFSHETFVIIRRLFKKRAQYWIVDRNGEEIIGHFFDNELIKVYANWKNLA